MISWGVTWVAWLPALLALAFVQVRDRVEVGYMLGVLFLSTHAFWTASVALPTPRAGLFAGGVADSLSPISVNLIPFRSLLDVIPHQSLGQAVREHGGNLLLLAPFTAIAPALWPALRAWRWALMIGTGGSVAIELLQLCFSALIGHGYRAADIDDVILNTTGALLGYAVFRGAYRYQGNRRT